MKTECGWGHPMDPVNEGFGICYAKNCGYGAYSIWPLNWTSLTDVVESFVTREKALGYLDWYMDTLRERNK